MTPSTWGHKVLHLQYTRDFEVQLRDSSTDLIRKLFPIDSTQKQAIMCRSRVFLLGPSIYSQILAVVKHPVCNTEKPCLKLSPHSSTSAAWSVSPLTSHKSWALSPNHENRGHYQRQCATLPKSYSYPQFSMGPEIPVSGTQNYKLFAGTKKMKINRSFCALGCGPQRPLKNKLASFLLLV